MSWGGREARSCSGSGKDVGGKKGNKVEARINGVASGANSAFTNISSSDSHPGNLATALRQTVQLPDHLLGIPGLERGRKSLRGARKPLFSYTPTSGDETPGSAEPSLELPSFDVASGKCISGWCFGDSSLPQPRP